MFSSLIRSVTLLLSAVAVFSPAVAQQKLAWKFNPGSQFKYDVTQTMVMEVTVAGNKTTQEIKQNMVMGWDVQKLGAAGDAVVGQTIERINMDFSGSLIEPFKYDSADKAPPTTSMGRRIADSYSRILNQQFQVSMKPTGEITNVKIPETLMSALTTSGNGVLTESMVKQMMTQSAITLPPAAVAPRTQWTTRQSVDLPYGKMSITSVLTCRRIDSSTGMAIIAVAPDIRIESGEDAAQQVTLNKSEGKGEVSFDFMNGRIAKSTLDLKMDMTVRLNEQQIEQTVSQNLSMVLSE
ncbi:MAG: hypothetical protein ACKO2P_08880 [Planctomycetota bacterium]